MTAWLRREVLAEGVELYLGDCREVLPTLQLGKGVAVVADVPYGVNLNTDNSRFSGGHVRRGGNRVGSAGGKPIVNDDKAFDPTHLLAYGDAQVIWGWNNFPDKLPAGTMLVWLKRNDDAFGSFLSDAEVAWLSKGRGIYCRRDLSNTALQIERVHPTQKPEGIMEWCLGFVPKAGHILDPYMGSGTTGVVAVRQRKAFTGVEIDEGHFDTALRRIDLELRQPRMFVAPPAPAEQTSLVLEGSE